MGHGSGFTHPGRTLRLAYLGQDIDTARSLAEALPAATSAHGLVEDASSSPAPAPVAEVTVFAGDGGVELAQAIACVCEASWASTRFAGLAHAVSERHKALIGADIVVDATELDEGSAPCDDPAQADPSGHATLASADMAAATQRESPAPVDQPTGEVFFAPAAEITTASAPADMPSVATPPNAAHAGIPAAAAAGAAHPAARPASLPSPDTDRDTLILDMALLAPDAVLVGLHAGASAADALSRALDDRLRKEPSL